jgi:hypothetical protein
MDDEFDSAFDEYNASVDSGGSGGTASGGILDSILRTGLGAYQTNVNGATQTAALKAQQKKAKPISLPLIIGGAFALLLVVLLIGRK